MPPTFTPCQQHPHAEPNVFVLGEMRRRFDGSKLYEYGTNRTQCGHAGCSHVIIDVLFEHIRADRPATEENVISGLIANNGNHISRTRIAVTGIGWCTECMNGVVNAEADVGSRQAVWGCEACGRGGTCNY